MQEQCTREELRVDAIVTVPADDNGVPICDVSSGDPIEKDPYWCSVCDNVFQTWDEALGHLTKQGAA
jgi:hypothetical protein